MAPLTFAYYCSGHGYGHATRVSAFATHLRELDNPPTIHIISSAPKHVFEQAIGAGSLYRYAEIDPVIVQPLAYHVDRRKSVDVLKLFLAQAEQKIQEEASWLKENNVDCVLSDAAFLPCKAANVAFIPSVLITNFSFDSVYSYLSINLSSSSSSLLSPTIQSPTGVFFQKLIELEDEPILPEELEPLVQQLHSGYRCAQLLLLLPGNIPMPSFSIEPSLPSYVWTNAKTNTFHPHIFDSLSSDVSDVPLWPTLPFDSTTIQKTLPRAVVPSPLIVRHPSSDVYTASGRKRVLDYIGIPEHFQSKDTKILIVSFGGQFFRKPRSSSSSRSSSPGGSTISLPPSLVSVSRTSSTESATTSASSRSSSSGTSQSSADEMIDWPQQQVRILGTDVDMSEGIDDDLVCAQQPLTGSKQVWFSDVPPTQKLEISPFYLTEDDLQVSPTSPLDTPLSPTPRIELGGQTRRRSSEVDVPEQESEKGGANGAHFLPDNSWIAIICGVSLSDDDENLPENFFVAPKDVYMPDLTAVADVLLGKLGYGTVSECVDACTPFVYVPRPLFVEEHGLRRLLSLEGVGVELSRERYESCDWANAVQTAWSKGQEAKKRKREFGDDGSRQSAAKEMAYHLVNWVEEWYERGRR